MGEQTHATNETVPPAPLARTALWLLGAVLIAALMVGILKTGPFLELSEYFRDYVSTPMALYAAACGVYLLAVGLAPRAKLSRPVLAAMVLLGLAIRLPMFLAPAQSGNDYNRYLWDGAMVAHGQNPYRYSPQDILASKADDPTIRKLVAAGGGDILDRTNHPDLRTIYPPLAEGLFALGYRITPFHLMGWKLVILACDALTALLVFSLLRQAGKPLSWASIYLWCPLLAVEMYSGAHVDMAVALTVTLLAWCLAKSRPISAGAALAAAVAAKLWPLMFGCFLLRAGWANKRRLVVALLVLAALAGPVLAGYFLATRAQGSGPGAYAERSHDNFWAHTYITYASDWAITLLGLSADSERASRYLTAGVLAILAVAIGLRGRNDAEGVCARVGALTLIMLLIMPTNYPWYLVSVLPLAAVTRRWYMVAAVALFPLTYLPRKLFPETPLMWAVHLPIWLLLAGAAARGLWQWAQPRRDRPAITPESH